jgi:hypothetical protein
MGRIGGDQIVKVKFFSDSAACRRLEGRLIWLEPTTDYSFHNTYFS